MRNDEYKENKELNEKNPIQNNNILNTISLEKENEDNMLDEEIIYDQENNNENEINEIKKKKSNYKLKYTELLNELRKNDYKDKHHNNEFVCNILLTPSEIDFSDEISTLSLLTYCYQENEKVELIYKIARKFEESVSNNNAIDPLFYMHIFFRAAYFLTLEKQYIYSMKYLIKCQNIIKKNRKINQKKITKVNYYYSEICSNIAKYLNISKNNFLEDDKFFSPIKCHEIKDIIDQILKNKYIINDNNNENLYAINKIWLVNLKQFLEDYITAIEMKTIEIFSNSFDYDYFLECYFNNNNKDKKKQNKNQDNKSKKGKEMLKYAAFPGPINNYYITEFEDYWYDNNNKDENYFIKKDMKLNEDYYLINEKDWQKLSSDFNHTNEIKRKRNNLDLIKLEFILFDKRINKTNNNMDLLKFRYIQINRNSTIKQLKEKIINVVDYNLGKYENKKSDSQNNENINDIENKNVNNKQICFYSLNKDNKILLIEICYSFYINNKQYDSLNINKCNLEDESLLINNLPILCGDENILIIEVIQNNEQYFFEDLKIRMNSEYRCTICNKKLSHINEKYNCNFCQLSLFCSKKCADKSLEHQNLDKILITIIEPKFKFSNLLPLKIESLLKKGTTRGRVGLQNLGNTCYLNSSLQCLSNTEDLTKYFLNEDFTKEINNANSSSSKGAISKSYYNLIYQMWKGSNEIISPSEFRLTFCRKEISFYNNEQQDSQEFLFALLNNLHEDLNRVTNKIYMELKEKGENETDDQASIRYWDYHKSREDSIIVDLFQGQYKSTIMCKKCGNKSITFDSYMNLQLPIPSKKLQNQIKFFTSNRKVIDLNINFDKNTEIKDIIKKAILYLDKKKYLDYLTYIKLKNNIFNFNNTEVPENILYDNIIIAEFDKHFKMTNVYKTSYKTIRKNKKNKDNIGQLDYVIINDRNDIDITYDKHKLLNIYENNKGREIVLFEKNMNSNDVNNIDIFVYPITEFEKIGVMNKVTKMLLLSYPIIITLNKNDKLKDLKSQINKMFINNLFKKEKNKSEPISICFPHFTNKWQNLKIKQNICPVCQENYNKSKYFCCLFDKYEENQYISDLIDNTSKDRPLILFAHSLKYNPKSEIYKNMRLFNEDARNDIDAKNELTIYDSLALFHKEESLEGEDKWFCSKCKKHQNASKKMEIYKTPYYLIVQLKRFKQRNSLMRNVLGSKNETLIDYKEILNLSDFVVGPDKDKSIYYLYGVVVHISIFNGGHYISYCKNQGDWLIYNDVKVGYCKNPINKGAYLLFYKRKSYD